MKFRERVKHTLSRLIKAKDTPHHIALGFAIGVFYGLFPLVGVIFTLVTAMIFRANKVAALVGVFVTNTWMSAILAVPSVQIGAKIFGLDWQAVWDDLRRYLFMSDFRDIFKVASKDVLIPTVVGFLVIAFCIALAGYGVSLFLVIKYRARKKSRR
jgi:uncharacterized protein (DUF2062 family)